MVGAGIGTVERLGSMTPEELEAIPGIDEEIVGQIQAGGVGFYGQYEELKAEARRVPRANVTTMPPEQRLRNLLRRRCASFENIETGVLEHDLARNEPARWRKPKKAKS